MPQAVTIRVRCRADGFADTLRHIAWTVGHRVGFEPCDGGEPERVAVVLTDLDYGDDKHVLEDLGLDILGKVDGVLSWSVVPREARKSREELPPRAE